MCAEGWQISFSCREVMSTSFFLESEILWMTAGGSVCLQLPECWRESRVLRIEWELISKEGRVMYCCRMGKLYAPGPRRRDPPSIWHRNAKFPLIVVSRYFKVSTCLRPQHVDRQDRVFEQWVLPVASQINQKKWKSSESTGTIQLSQSCIDFASQSGDNQKKVK